MLMRRETLRMQPRSRAAACQTDKSHPAARSPHHSREPIGRRDTESRAQSPLDTVRIAAVERESDCSRLKAVDRSNRIARSARLAALRSRHAERGRAYEARDAERRSERRRRASATATLARCDRRIDRARQCSGTREGLKLPKSRVRWRRSADRGAAEPVVPRRARGWHCTPLRVAALAGRGGSRWPRPTQRPVDLFERRLSARSRSRPALGSSAVGLSSARRVARIVIARAEVSRVRNVGSAAYCRQRTPATVPLARSLRAVPLRARPQTVCKIRCRSRSASATGRRPLRRRAPPTARKVGAARDRRRVAHCPTPWPPRRFPGSSSQSPEPS